MENRVVKYTYRFENKGAKKVGSLLENEVWFDVGNELEMGCFDHHQGSGCSSAFEALIKNCQYLDDLKSYLEKETENPEIIIHVHESPDLDCISCVYAIKKLAEEGEEKFYEFINGIGRDVAQYINNIDSGKGKVVTIPTLYAIYTVLDKFVSVDDSEKDKAILEKAINLFCIALNALTEKEIRNLEEGDLEKFITDDYPNEIEYIKSEAKRIYQYEKNHNIVVKESIKIWKKEEQNDGIKYIAEDVDAYIWEKIPMGENGYVYARNEGACITVVPQHIKGVDGETTTLIITINPDMNIEKKYTLKPLAELLEQMEQIAEQSEYEKTGRYRRNHSRPRNNGDGDLHLGSKPFSETIDPWFIKPDEDLVAAPGVGSLLDYNDILEVIRNNANVVKNSFVLPLSENTEPENLANIPISNWNQKVRNIIDSASKKSGSDHFFIYGEIDASLISGSNKILEAFCMNLIDRPLNESNRNDFLHLDYRTCIYSDVNYTVVLVATYSEENLKELPIYNLIIGSDNKLEKDKLINDIGNIVGHRKRLIDLGSQINESVLSNRKIIEKLNKEMLEFTAKAQKDAILPDPVEKEIYDFIYGRFGIVEQRNEVVGEISILTGESRDRHVSKFNNLMALAAPVVLIATVFQSGIIKFDSLFEISGGKTTWAGCKSINAWIAVGLIGLIIYIICRREK